MGLLQNVVQVFYLKGWNFLDHPLLHCTRNLRGDHCFQFSVTWNDTVDLWLLLSHFCGFCLLHLWAHQVIYVLNALAVQERGPSTYSFIVATDVRVLCKQERLARPGSIAQFRLQVFKWRHQRQARSFWPLIIRYRETKGDAYFRNTVHDRILGYENNVVQWVARLQ